MVSEQGEIIQHWRPLQRLQRHDSIALWRVGGS
jgi:hypothetical protein